MKRRGFEIVCVAAIVAALGSAASALEIETVPVGNLGNANDTEGDGYGAVSYAYNIGKYEVTAGQYRDFLNAVGKSTADTYGLYNSSMDSTYGCQITWNSASSTYDFSGAPSGDESDWVDRPVNYVSWYDAAMFANYLTSGNVNDGAYNTSTGDPVYWGDEDASKYTGITSHDSAEMVALVSTYGKVYVIPTEDEWYKAAYHKNDGNTGNYYDYPTSSNSAPGYVDNAGELSGTSTTFTDGVTDPGNYATYDGDGGTDGIGPDYYRTEVGEWENSDSPYDTFDQGGNVWEWNEAIISGSHRGLRGGSFSYGGDDLHASSRSYRDNPTYEGYVIGFRVSEVPEPATMAIFMLGGIGILRRRRKQ